MKRNRGSLSEHTAWNTTNNIKCFSKDPISGNIIPSSILSQSASISVVFHPGFKYHGSLSWSKSQDDHQRSKYYWMGWQYHCRRPCNTYGMSTIYSLGVISYNFGRRVKVHRFKKCFSLVNLESTFPVESTQQWHGATIGEFSKVQKERSLLNTVITPNECTIKIERGGNTTERKSLMIG